MTKYALNVQNGKEMSLSKMLQTENDGYYVARTSHVGNQYLSNMALLAAGFPAQLYDRNLTFFDENYHPSQIILNGRQSTICHEGNVLTPFGEICRDEHSPIIARLINGYDNLANFHLESLKKIYGNLITTESEFYLKRMEITEEISAIINFYFPDSFNRRITSRGLTYSSKRRLATNEFCKVNNKTINTLQNLATAKNSDSFEMGSLPTLSAVLVINTVLASLASNKDIVFELAGPDMANYMYNKARQNEINKMYATLADNFPGLPEQLTLTVVPTFYFRFAVLESELPALDNLIENLLRYRQISKEKKILLNQAKQGRKMDNALQEELRIISAPLSNKAISLAHAMHENRLTERLLSQNNLCEGNFFSHYDLLAAKEPLVISPLAKDFSMAECQSLMETLAQSKRMATR